MFRSRLQRAIDRGMKPEGDLSEELGKLEDYQIRSRKDGRAICAALRELRENRSDGKSLTSSLHSLTGLFQDVESRDVPAFEVLYTEGLPELIRLANAGLQQPDEEETDDLLFVLKVLAMYGSREGAETVAAAARRPLKPDAYMWHPIMSCFAAGHPHAEFVFQALSDPLPTDFLAVALLDAANQAARESGLEHHPFDSEPGWQRLEACLQDPVSEHFSYAHSATAALPFMTNPPRDQLLALAMDHADAGVQMEAAWASAKLGREAGLRILARYCLDVNQSDTARHYLAELNREDLIPPEASDPAFRAEADFAAWLAHPNELGQPPDELEIVDHRTLEWPPGREPKPFWLIRYLLRDRTGLQEDDIDCGLVGSMTWCFFSYRMHERPPEDAYAIHCYWEMQHARLIDEVEAEEAAEYADMLSQWQGAPLQRAEIIHVATLSRKLNYPTKRVALASAALNGQEGWAVLDGPASVWYPKSEQPEDSPGRVVLMIHVGRQLLGFDGAPDRKKYLVSDRPQRPPERIVAAYEKLLDEAAGSELEGLKKLLDGWGLLSKHFDDYVEALATLKNAAKADALTQAYEQFLHFAEQADESVRREVYGRTSVLRDAFDDYIGALISDGRAAEIGALIARFAPHWENNAGYSRLGGAA
ncbi:MAG TPA: hypothetical protein VHC19_26480, partial [Pirellulales bacterium]|nr:hypothetical protein [Pirellulales bacterium]